MTSRPCNRAAIEDDLLACLLAIRLPVEKPPKGHLTTAQWATKWKMKPHLAERLLRLGVQKGKVAWKLYRVPVGTTGRLKKVRHYYEA